jgi:hypothetical protein
MVQPAQLWKKERKNLGMIRENFHLKPFLPDLRMSALDPAKNTHEIDEEVCLI